MTSHLCSILITPQCKHCVEHFYITKIFRSKGLIHRNQFSDVQYQESKPWPVFNKKKKKNETYFRSDLHCSKCHRCHISWQDQVFSIMFSNYLSRQIVYRTLPLEPAVEGWHVTVQVKLVSGQQHHSFMLFRFSQLPVFMLSFKQCWVVLLIHWALPPVIRKSMLYGQLLLRGKRNNYTSQKLCHAI